MINGIGGSPLGLGALHQTQHSKTTAFERLASGKRINSAADDAANLATVQQFLAIEAGAAQGTRNLADGQSLARVAEAGLGASSELISRMRELGVQAGNGALNDGDRAIIQQEYDQLSAELDRISASTQFNGKSLLDGSAGGAGSIDLVDGSGGASTRIDIGDHSAASLGLAGLSLSNPASLGALDSALQAVTNSRARLGAVHNRLGSQIENLRTTADNTAAARSRISDTDYAAETAQLTKSQILEESQLALRIKGRIEPATVLRLLS